MAYGVVLRPDPQASSALANLAAAVGSAADPIVLLGRDALPHVTIAHAETTPEQADTVREFARSYAQQSFAVKITGLVYAVIPRGDFYLPPGGIYFGLEVVRRPDLDAVHRDVVEAVAAMGARVLGASGPDYRPHVTLGTSRRRPALPDLAMVPLGELPMTLATGTVGIHGTFPRWDDV